MTAAALRGHGNLFITEVASAPEEEGAGIATGGGRGRQRTRSAVAIGQRSRTERVDRHRLQNLSCPLRGASGRGNGRGRRFYNEAAGAIKDRPEAELGGNERVRTRALGDGENLLGGQRGEELPSAAGGARAAHCRAKLCRKIDD